MKLFLDTANVEAIKQWSAIGLLDGVTTNPTNLSREGKDPIKQVLEICALLPHGDISVEITEKEPEKIYLQAKKIAQLANNVIVKVPCHKDYYAVIKRLVNENIKLNITLVFSLVQGFMMSKLGVTYISPFVGRLEDNDSDGSELLYAMDRMIDNYGFDTQILAASLRSVRHLHNAIMAGCDAATVPVDLLEKSISHVLTDKGIGQFDVDWQRLGITKFP